MKLFPKFLLAALVIAMLLPFTILKKDDGTPMMSFSSFGLPDFSAPRLPDLPRVDSITDSVGGGGEVAIYQWQDSEGNIQFTNEAPPEGVEYQIRHYDPNANVIQSVKLPAEETEPKAGETEQPSTTGALETPSPYSPDGVKKMMEETRNIEKLLNQRFQDQQSAIN